MPRALLFALTCGMLAMPAQADPKRMTIGQDHFLAGASLTFDGPAADDLFMAGNRLAVTAAVGGSAHLTGRRVTVAAPLAGDLFALGYSVTQRAPTEGDASIAGYEVMLAAVGGNLRVIGAEVSVGSVGGYALVTGADVTLQGVIAGDAVLVVDDITFGPQAQVAGLLTIYAQDPTRISVPARVAPASRVTVTQSAQHDRATMADRMPKPVPLWRMVVATAVSILFFGLIIGLIATAAFAIAPRSVQRWRMLALAQPGHAIWSGFLVTAMLAGSGFVLMLTLVGVFFVPVTLAATLLALTAGLALGTYLLGVGLWQAAGQPVPDGLPGKAALAFLGATLAGVILLIPLVGWLCVLVLTLWGIGTLAAFVLPGGWLLHRDTPRETPIV